MFGLFRKSVHEPVSKQREDLAMYPGPFAEMIVGGEDCDELSAGSGPFGSQHNPIPVNGALGEIKYLGKLRGKTEHALFFHRIGSLDSNATKHNVDCYEVVCLDGTQWGKLYFDLYHPRRSNKTPDGYELTLYDKSLGTDLPLGYGVNSMVTDFPHGMPEQLVGAYGMEALARHARDWLSKHEFARPAS